MFSNDTRSVLVVDQDLDYIEACRDSLQNDAFNSYTCHGSAHDQAEVTLRSTPYTCVILVHGQGEDAFALLKFIHSLPLAQQPAVVFSTRDDDATTAVTALKQGAQDYLSKAAMTPDSLNSAVRNAIELHQRQQAEAEAIEEVEHMALHDPLTDLANRTLFNNRLEHSVNLAQRNSQKIAVLMIDLNGFKEVNDTYGHEAGDEVLKQLSQRLQGCLRRTDTLARLGGDEFAILLEGIAAPTDTYHVLRRILTADDEPILFKDIPLQIGMSIGFAVYPDSSSSAKRLLETADHTMYAAKRCGGGFAKPADFPAPEQIHAVTPADSVAVPESTA